MTTQKKSPQKAATDIVESMSRLKLLITGGGSAGAVLVAAIAVIWQLYAQPAIQQQIDCSVDPVEESIERMADGISLMSHIMMVTADSTKVEHAIRNYQIEKAFKGHKEKPLK